MISMSTSRGGEEASSLETPGERRCGRGPGEEWEEGEVKGKKGKKGIKWKKGVLCAWSPEGHDQGSSYHVIHVVE